MEEIPQCVTYMTLGGEPALQGAAGVAVCSVWWMW